jgi:hypothetical protein
MPFLALSSAPLMLGPAKRNPKSGFRSTEEVPAMILYIVGGQGGIMK